jgi:hypothetical protein
MRVHPSDSLSLQSGKSPLHRSSPAGSSRVGPLLQVPSRDIRAPGHASRRVHKTTFPQPTHVYEVRPRKDHRGVDLISDALPFGRLWYGEPDAIGNAVEYAKFRSRSHDAVICVYDEAGNVIENARAQGDFKEP